MRRTVGKISTRQNLSSESLFHFTSNIDVLILILIKGFQARYLYEKIPGTKLAYFVKTSCFCDIPLGAIKWHFNWYGNYGIGINRPWSKKHNISPVTYIHKETPFITKSSAFKNREFLQNSPITPYLKQVKGKQFFIDKTSGKEYWKWKKFYEEREWRYFPLNSDLQVKRYSNERELEDIRTKLNEGHLPHLKIDLQAIEYIIINDRSELPKIIACIKKLTISTREQEKLISKIIAASQIRRDF